MVNVTKYNIFRITTNRVSNDWNEEIFSAGQIVQCTEDMGTIWFAKPIGTDAIPRMLPKSECRQLTEDEKAALPQWAKG